MAFSWSKYTFRVKNLVYFIILLSTPIISYPADTDVFKTSSGRLKKVTTSYDQTRRPQDVWQKTSYLRRLEDVGFTSSWRCQIYDVLKTSDLQCLEDVYFMTSWRRRIYVFLKTSDLRCLEDVWFTTSWRRLIYDVLKTLDLCLLENVNLWCLEHVWFTTSWRRRIYVFLKTSDLWCLEDVCFTTSWIHLIYDVLKTSVERRLCSNVVATSTQGRNKFLSCIVWNIQKVLSASV